MKNKATSSNNIILFTAGFFALFMILGFVFFLVRIEDAKSDRGELFNILNEVRARRDSAEKFKDIYFDTERERLILKDFVLSDEDVVSLIRTVESLTDGTNASIEVTSVDIEGSNNEKGQGAEEVALKFEVQGRFLEILHILSLAETIPQVSYLSSFRISVQSSAGNVWRAFAELRVFKMGLNIP